MPVVSVVVPFYNVVDYFDDLLESLRLQTHPDLDVVLVDDGSTDGSRALAEKAADRDGRFRIVEQHNQGAGPARNLGVREARGDFLAFADADDVVHLDAYRRMLDRLLESGSDFVTSRAGRFSSHGTRPSVSQHAAIHRPARRVTIADVPTLGLDRMVWNKVFRRDFWDRHGFVYPAGGLQDYPVSSRAHVAATAVDVMTDWLYYWREREGGESSTTQRFAHLPLVADRVRSDIDVLDTIGRGAPASLPLVARGFAEVDIAAMARAITGEDPERDRAALALVQELQERLGFGASADLAPYHRILAHLIAAGDAPGLIAMNEYAARRGRRALVVTAPSGAYVEAFPVLGSDTVPEEAFVPTGGMPEFQVSIDDVQWDDGVLHLDLLLRTAVRLGEETTVALSLVSEQETVPLPVERHAWQRPLVGEDLVGVRTRVDATALAVGRFCALEVEVSGPEISHTSRVAAAPLGRGFIVPSAAIPGHPDLLAGLGRFGHDRFGVVVRRPRAVVEEIRATGSGFEVHGWLAVSGRRRPEVALRVAGPTGADRDHPVSLGRRERRQGRRPFAVTVPFDDVVDASLNHDSPVTDRRTERARLVVDGEDVLMRTGPGLDACYVPLDSRMAMAAPGPRGQLELGDVGLLPLVDGVTWTDDATLVLSGRWPGTAPLPGHVLLEHFETPMSPDRLQLPLQAGPDGSFRVTIDAGELVRRQVGGPLHHEGRGIRPWHVLVPFADRRRAVVVHRTALASFAPPRNVDGHRVAWRAVHGDVFHLAIR